MKNRIWKQSQLLIVLGGFGFALGCASEPGPANASAESLENAVMATTNQVEAADAVVTSEPIQTVPPVPIETTPGVSEVIKLVQNGVDEGVILAYIENSDSFGVLSTEEVTYLRDIGVDAKLVTAMIRRGHALQNQSAAQTAEETAASQRAASQTEMAPNPTPQPPVVTQGTPVTVAPQSVVNAPSTPIVVESDPVVIQQPQQQVTVTYFQETLSPYGTWVELPDYGWTWRPTIAVADPYWRPYHHGGRWLYSDLGWYWQSDYSWGWAPFHYGRWFRHYHYGWMWHPGTVWGPSWVTWRRTPLYCGWAPLPPWTHYQHGPHGFGLYYHDRLVDAHFGFGLSYHHYTFLPFRHFGDRHPYHHYLPYSHVRDVYQNSTVINNYFIGPNKVVINKGIDRKQVAALSRNEIKTVAVKELPIGAGQVIKPDRIERRGDRAVIYKPNPQVAPTSVQTPLVNVSRQEIRSAFVPEGRRIEQRQGQAMPSEPARRPVLSTAGHRSVAPSAPSGPLNSSRVSRSSSQGVPITRIDPRSVASGLERQPAAPLAVNPSPAGAPPGSAAPAASRAIAPAAPTPAVQPEHWSQALGFPRTTESRQQPAVSTPQAIQSPSPSTFRSPSSGYSRPALNMGSQAASSSVLPMENRTIVPPPSTPAPISRSLQEPRSSRVITAPSRSYAPQFPNANPAPAFPSRSEPLSAPAYTPPRAVPQPSGPAMPAPRSIPTPAFQRPIVTTPSPAIRPSAPSFPSPSPRSVAPPSFSRPAMTPSAPAPSIRPGTLSGGSVPRPAPTPAPAPSAGSDPRRGGERSSSR